jgi:adenylate cyclase
VKQYKPAARDLRQVAGELGVANLLEGTVQHAANRVRVTVQLIDARTDARLWAERYDHELADVFAVESDIAKTIARELGARLSPAEEAAIAAGGGHP